MHFTAQSSVGFFNFSEAFDHACMQDYSLDVREQIVTVFINKNFSHCLTAVI